LPSVIPVLLIQTRETMSDTNYIKKPSRAKKDLVWEKLDHDSGGAYNKSYHEIAHRFPALTPKQLQVCTLISAGQDTDTIAGNLRLRQKPSKGIEAESDGGLDCIMEKIFKPSCKEFKIFTQIEGS